MLWSQRSRRGVKEPVHWRSPIFLLATLICATSTNLVPRSRRCATRQCTSRQCSPPHVCKMSSGLSCRDASHNCCVIHRTAKWRFRHLSRRTEGTRQRWGWWGRRRHYGFWQSVACWSSCLGSNFWGRGAGARNMIVHRSLWDNCADIQSKFDSNQVETQLELISLFLTFRPKLWEQQKPKEPNNFHPNSTFCTYYPAKLRCWFSVSTPCYVTGTPT